MRRGLILALVLAASPAHGQTPVNSGSTPTPIDPSALAAGTRIAAAVLPEGTYRKMMSSTFERIFSGMIDKMGEIPIKQMLIAAGAKPEAVPDIKPDALRQVMQITDPNYKERTDLGMKAMLRVLADIMVGYEPTIRAGLAEAYARQFTPAELADIEHFFSTPSGSVFAGRTMLMTTDPAVIDRISGIMPDLMKQMPKMIGAMVEATKELPKPRTYKDLTPAEQAKISDLLGLDPKKTKP